MKKITLCLMFALLCTVFAFSQGNKRSISVSGSGSIRVPADTARLTFSVITKEKMALDSVQNNATKMNNVYDALKKIGIDEKNISTSNYSLYQETIYKDGKNEPGFYVTSNDIIVLLDDVDKSGIVIDTAIAAGVNRMNGISFLVRDSQAALDQARVLAFQQAKEKAELYAKEAGCKLGKVISIVENNDYYPAVRESMDMKLMAASNTTTISAGTDAITASVSVVFELE